MNPRKSNVESGEEKRKKILLGVEQVIAEKGYTGATMKAVASAADVSPGLLHYYFADKEEMMLAMMRFNAERLMDLFQQAFAGLEPGDDAAAVITREYRRMHEEAPSYFNIFAECWPLLWTSKAMHQGFRDLFVEFREGVMALLKMLEERGVVRLNLPLKETAAMINAQCDGLELQLRVDPDLIGDQGFWDAYEFTLRAFFED